MTRKLLPILIALFLLIPGTAMAVKVGDKAPGFKAISNKGEVSLDSFIGKKNVILAFYFAINTPAWKSTVLAFKKDLEKFESLNTQVLGVSSDSMETLNRFAREHSIKFPLIADKTGELKALYSKRRINYLIDIEGTVRVIQKGVPANEYFLEKIKALGL